MPTKIRATVGPSTINSYTDKIFMPTVPFHLPIITTVPFHLPIITTVPLMLTSYFLCMQTAALSSPDKLSPSSLPSPSIAHKFQCVIVCELFRRLFDHFQVQCFGLHFAKFQLFTVTSNSLELCCWSA